MIVAMLMSGTIGWLVVASRQAPINIAFLRCVLGGVTLTLVCAALGLLRRKHLPPRTLALAVLGGAAIVANWVLLFAAYSRASISMATAVYNTQPFMLVGLGVVILRERVSASTVAWLAVAFLGLVCVVEVQPAVLAVPGEYLQGVAYAAGAAFLYAISSIITRHLKGTPPHLIALVQLAFGALALAPFIHYGTLPGKVGILCRFSSAHPASCPACELAGGSLRAFNHPCNFVEGHGEDVVQDEGNALGGIQCIEDYEHSETNRIGQERFLFRVGPRLMVGS